MSAHPLRNWEPENQDFWLSRGRFVARRNLVASVPPLVLSFAVWMLWSVVVLYLPLLGFRFGTNQLFWLAAAPGLAGGTLRLFFSFMVPIFGGRRWTVVSTLLLLLPTVGLGVAVQDPTTRYPTFLALALAAGIGGGNFASSMANISFFYPTAHKGAALGVNAGLGNLGVGLAQLVVPLAVATALFGALGGAAQALADTGEVREVWLQNAGFVWVPFILLAAAIAWYAMDDVADLRASVADQAVVFLRRHTWVLAWLYLGTFGSFVGFAAGLPLVAETEFGIVGIPWIAVLGPFAAALARPVGGWLADRHGGARVAQASFAALAVATAALSLLAPAVVGGGVPAGGGANVPAAVASNAVTTAGNEVPAAAGGPATGIADGGGYAVFLALSSVLFIASGVGNGAVFQLIPAVFVAEHLAAAGSDAGAASRAQRDGILEGAAALGLTSGIAAFGGFFIPKAYGTAIAVTGSTAPALYAFTFFYFTCLAVTWWFYLRGGIDRSQGLVRLNH